MRQRVGEKKRKKVEALTGYPIESMWARGGRNPRYWQVFFLPETLDRNDGGAVGHYYPDTQEIVMTDGKWRGQ